MWRSFLRPEPEDVLRSGDREEVTLVSTFETYCLFEKTRHAVAQARGFDFHNSSGRNMALGLTQTLTQMSTRDIFWG